MPCLDHQKGHQRRPQAAGKIHSDFERGFIRAQVIHYQDLADADFKLRGGEIQGPVSTPRARDYVVQDGDVIEFLFNV